MARPAPTAVVVVIVMTVSMLAAACAQPDAPRASRAGGSADAGPALRQPDDVGRVPRSGPADAPRPRIVFLGDSLTAGLGLDPAQSVPALIQERLTGEGYAYDVVNAGVSGDTTAGGLSRLDWSLDGDVRILVIELGGNDGLRGLPVAAIKRNLTQILERARERQVHVLLTGMEAPPNFGASYTTEFRQVFRDLAREHGVSFMPFFLDGVAGNPKLNQADGIHPNPAGARVVEANVWHALEPLLEKSTQDR